MTKLRHTSIFLLFASMLAASLVRAQTPSMSRVSVATSGAQATSGSLAPSISADDRFFGFASAAARLVAGDTNGRYDVFLRNRSSETTERVSVSSAGVQGNGDSYRSAMSADGRFVAFHSEASNLVANDTNFSPDVFVRDRQSGTTERVSVSTSGAQGGDSKGWQPSSLWPSISADGRFVFFHSQASNLVVGDSNSSPDVFVHDRTLSTTERISVSTAGVEGDWYSQFPACSSDGRFVVFMSGASNFVAGDTNARQDIFLRDRSSGTTERVSISSAGAQSDGPSQYPAISSDGRFVAFVSYATNLVVGDTNGINDVFVRDLVTGTTERVNVATGGGEGIYTGFNVLYCAPSISSDGRFVAFANDCTNLVLGDSFGAADIFLRDRALGTTERVSAAPNGADALGWSYYPSISDDGRFVVFQSMAPNLVAGDTNGVLDAFALDRGQPPPKPYCTSGTSTHGCTASIAASANPSLSLASACIITVTNVEGLRSGILFYGIYNTLYSPIPWAPASTSWLCLRSPTQRTPLQNSGGNYGMCNGLFALDWNVYQSTHLLAIGQPWVLDAKVYVQAWFHDLLAIKSTNLSNAVEMTYGP